MARPLKKGLVYFPHDTDYYDDFKIVDLMYEHGPLGQTVYDVILTVIYKNGYYVELQIEKMVQIVIRTIGNRWAKKDAVAQVILYCGEIGLFDKALLLRNVFTSAGIQRRYEEVNARNKVDKSRYWLLDENGQPLESASNPPVFAAETPVIVTKTPVFAAEMQQIKSKRKEKENIKENYYDGDSARAEEIDEADEEDKLTISDTAHRAVMLTDRQMDDLLDRLTFDEFNYYVEKLGSFIVDKGAHVKNHYETILKWVAEDRRMTGGTT